MTKEETIELLGLIQVAFRIFKLPEGTTELSPVINMWFACLADLPFDVVKLALKQFVLEGEKDYRGIYRPPEIQDLRSMTVNILRGRTEEISGQEAWAQIKTALLRYGYTGQEQGLKMLPPLVAEAVKRFGWNRLGKIPQEEEAGIRYAERDFIAFFESYRERDRKQAQLPESTKKAIAAASEDNQKRAQALLGNVTKQLKSL